MTDVKDALKLQYHGGLEMLRQAVERCPEVVWCSGVHPRTYWRIAYHAVYYTHLYLGQDEDAFQPWDKERDHARILWEQPAEEAPYTRAEILEYIGHVDSLVDATVDGLDLSAPTTGFHWYPDMAKASHQLMNLRHLQGHVGQLSEILMQHGVDIDWVSESPSK